MKTNRSIVFESYRTKSWSRLQKKKLKSLCLLLNKSECVLIKFSLKFWKYHKLIYLQNSLPSLWSQDIDQQLVIIYPEYSMWRPVRAQLDDKKKNPILTKLEKVTKHLSEKHKCIIRIAFSNNTTRTSRSSNIIMNFRPIKNPAKPV